MWVGVQHWCSVLTEIRRVLHNADWDVRVDDHSIQWDEDAGEYDPRQVRIFELLRPRTVNQWCTNSES